MLAAPAQAALVYALTDENDLLSFNSAAPEDLLSGGAITGLGGQDLLGIDFRPSNNKLYGVGSFGGIFSIDTTTRAATLVSTINVALNGTRYGIDFDPVADRLRIVSDLDQSLAVDVATGIATVNGNLNYSGGTPNPSVAGSAYTNNVNAGLGTILYGIDVRGSGDQLVTQNAGTGLLTPVGPLGTNVSALLGFDILNSNGQNIGFAAMQPGAGGTSIFYSINLLTGAALAIGEIGGGDLIDGIAVVIPEPSSVALAAFALVAGVAVRRRRR